MLERLPITNYQSIADAVVELRPFTLLVGANGSGKSNLLQLLQTLSAVHEGDDLHLTKHFGRSNERSWVELTADGEQFPFDPNEPAPAKPAALRSVRVFSINPTFIGGAESLVTNPAVMPNGQGAVQVLDSLKTGDREDLFEKIESTLHEFIPEFEKLSFVPGQNAKRLQVRERHIATPIPVSELSEGTRLVLTILTIVFQERKPSIICLEDLDRGIHPRLFGQVVDVCRNLVRGQNATLIIATTHNPYLVDQFVDDEESVLIVEKVDSNTSFTKLSDKLKDLADGETLGGKWFAGLVGGVPEKSLSQLPNLK